MTAKGIITHTRTLVIAVSLVFTLPFVSIFGGSQAEAQMGKRDMGLRPAPSSNPAEPKRVPQPGLTTNPASRANQLHVHLLSGRPRRHNR